MRASPRLRAFLTVLALFCAWRGTLFAIDALGASLTHVREPNPYSAYYIAKNHYFIDGWFRWDTYWYRRIVERGYFIEGPQSDVAFFPLFPYLARYLGVVVGSPYAAGLIVSNLSLLGALLYIYWLGRELYDEKRATSAVILTLCFPGSFFLSAFYADGLFLLAATGSAFYYHRRRFLAAGAMGFLACFARPTGLVLLGAFLADHAIEVWRRREPATLRVLFLLLIPGGLVAYMLMLWSQVGDPWAFARYQAGWGRATMFPLTPIWKTLAQFNWSFPRGAETNMDFVEAIFAIAFLAIPVVMAAKRVRAYLWLFVLGSVMMTLTSGKVQSMVRHASVCFPAFLYLAAATESRPWAQRYLVFVFSMLLLLFNLRFINWYWSG